MGRKLTAIHEKEALCKRCFCSYTEAVGFLQLDRKNFSEMQREGVVVRKGKLYDILGTAQNFIQRIRHSKKASGRKVDASDFVNGDPITLEAAKLRETTARAKRQEVALLRETGELVRAAEVREAGVRLGAIVSATLQAKPSEWAPLLAGKSEDDVFEIVTREIGTMLEVLKREVTERTLADGDRS